jgi:hypothetical protein
VRSADDGAGESARVAALHVASAALRARYTSGTVVQQALSFVARCSEAGKDPQAMTLRARALEAEGRPGAAREMYAAAHGFVERGAWRAEDPAREVVNTADLQFQYGSLLLRVVETNEEREKGLALIRKAAVDGGHYEAVLALARHAGTEPDEELLMKLAASGHAEAAARLGERYTQPAKKGGWLAAWIDRSAMRNRGLGALDTLSRTLAWQSEEKKRLGDPVWETRLALRRRELEGRLALAGRKATHGRRARAMLALDWLFLAAMLGDASACGKGADLAYALGLPAEVFLFYALMYRRKGEGAGVNYTAPKTDESTIVFVLGRDVYLWFAMLLERRGADEKLLKSMEKLIGFLGPGFKDTVNGARRLERRSS